MSTGQFIGLVEQEIGRPIQVRAAGKNMMRVVGLFKPEVREFVEIMYEFEEPFIIDHGRYVAAFGNGVTPHAQAIKETVAWYGRRAAGKEWRVARSPYEIVVKPVEALPVATLRTLVPDINEMGAYCAALTRSLYRKLRMASIPWSGPEVILYHGENYKEKDSDVEAWLVLPEVREIPVLGDEELQFRILPEQELMASLIYEGDFAEMTPAILELLRWVGLHNHVPVGPLRELHLSGPAPPEKPTAELTVVELQIPVKGSLSG